MRGTTGSDGGVSGLLVLLLLGGPAALAQAQFPASPKPAVPTTPSAPAAGTSPDTAHLAPQLTPGGVRFVFRERGTGPLIILSQVVLAFQLPFAIIPLVMFTRDRTKMGALVAPTWLTLVSAIIAAVIIALNVKLVWDLAAG